MSPVRVVTDSSCDLPQSLVLGNEIEMVPHTVRIGKDEIVDGGGAGREELWEKIAAAPAPIETMAPNAAQFSARFEALAASGADGILVLTMSGELSAAYQAAVLAGERLGGTPPVKVVDSRTVSMALGLLVLDTARRARRGATLDDLSASAAERAAGTGLALAIDSLDVLRSRRRIGLVQHVVAGWLDARPLVTVEDGVLVGAGNLTGGVESIEALAHMVERRAARLVDLAVLAAPLAATADLTARLSHLVPPERLHRSILGPVLGAYAGPGAIGVAWSTV